MKSIFLDPEDKRYGKWSLKKYLHGPIIAHCDAHYGNSGLKGSGVPIKNCSNCGDVIAPKWVKDWLNGD